MADDPTTRFFPTDPNGDPDWHPIWGSDGSMGYETIPTPQAVIRAFFLQAKTIKSLLDTAQKSENGITFDSTRPIRAGLEKLEALGFLAIRPLLILEQSDSPGNGVRTTVHSPHYANEELIQIINQVRMLPFRSDLESERTLTHEQIALFNARFDALQSMVDRLIPESAQSEPQSANDESNERFGDGHSIDEQPALTKNQANVLTTMALFDRAQLSSVASITTELPPTERLSEETVRLSVSRLIKLGYAERPEGARRGARLTNEGRRLSGKIAD